MEIKIVIGDWARDGHGRTTTARANVSGVRSTSEIEQAHKNGQKKLGFDFDDLIRREDNTQPTQLEKDTLINAGYTYPEMDRMYGGRWMEDKHYWMEPNELANIYMFLATIGNPNISYTLGQDERVPTINIPAYNILR